MIDVPAFVPRLPWIGGDLQTMRNFLRPTGDILAPWPGERVSFAMKDETGDELTGLLHRPSLERGAEERGRPLVLLLHGLTGSEESSYVRVSARELLQEGYPVLRLNWRGAGPGPGLGLGKTKAFYHAGRGSDLAAVLSSMGAELAKHGLAALGYSLGASILLNYLADRGGLSHLRAAIAVSPPLNLHAAQQRIATRRNRRYHDYLLARMLAERAAGGTFEGAKLRRIIDFDNDIVAPANGFKDALEYYARCSAGPRLAAIRTPTLIVHAKDDPWIPAASFKTIDWNTAKSVRLLMPWSGGHVGFHAMGLKRTWHDEVTLRFLASRF